MNEDNDIKKHALWEDYKEIFQQAEPGENIHLSGEMHTVEEDFPIFKILRSEHTRNYMKETSEFYVIHTYMAAGDYLYRVFPFKDNLEVSIRQTWLTSKGELNPDKPPKVIRYKAIFNPSENPSGDRDVLGSRKIDDLNRLAPVTMVLELQDRCEEAVRTKSISGIYHDVTMEDAIRAATHYEVSKVKVQGKVPIEVIDIVEPDNKKPYPYLLLPTNLFVEDLPGWLQEKAKGIYNTGIGSFFQRFEDKPTWFIYPLYNDTRFDKPGKKLVVYDVPQDKMSGMDTTFRKEGDILYIATTGNTGSLKTAFNRELNQGVGFRFADGESFMKKPVKITEDGVTAVRNRLNYELANHERKDQNPYSPTYQSTSNPYFVMSKNVAYQMTLHVVTWENGDSDLIYPGMPCRFIFADKDKRSEVDGTVVFCYSNTVIQGNPLEDRRHVRVSQLGLMLRRQDEKTEKPPTSLVAGDKF